MTQSKSDSTQGNTRALYGQTPSGSGGEGSESDKPVSLNRASLTTPDLAPRSSKKNAHNLATHS